MSRRKRATRGRSFVCDLETYEGAASALAEAARCFGGFAATSTVPRSSHATKQASLNSAQATDVGRQVGRTLRQTGLCLFARGGHLSLPAGKRLPYRYTNEEDGKTLRRYWTTACQSCSLKSQCTPGRERRVTRWEHEHLLEAVQCSLDANPEAMRQRRETVEHPFGTMKARMGATHFLTKTLPKVAAEMALSVLAYNLTRAMNIVGVKPLIAAIVA
jgi:Transposase DDE domain